MEIEVLAEASTAALAAATRIAHEARAVVAARGRFVLALSGGRTPWQMLRRLAAQEIPWEGVYVVQADERLAPAGDPERNLTQIEAILVSRGRLPPGRLYPMPVETEDLEAAATLYAQTLREIAGDPPILDLVHLGLGPDGHTASLVPGDPVLEISDRDVAPTGVYQGWRRLSLTYPIINRARRRLWLVTGADKAEMLRRLRNGDQSIPAGRICRDQTLVLADQAAAGRLGPR